MYTMRYYSTVFWGKCIQGREKIMMTITRSGYGLRLPVLGCRGRRSSKRPSFQPSILLSLLAVGMMLAGTARGTDLAVYTFTNSTYASSDTDIPTIASVVSIGSGLTGAGIRAAGGPQNGLSWGYPGPCVYVDSPYTPNTAPLALSQNEYLQFTITPVPSGNMTLASLSFDYAAVAGTTQPITINGFVRSSKDNYAANLLTWGPNTVGAGTSLGWATKTITLGGVTFSDLTAAVTFRIYLWDDKDVTTRGHFVDNIKVTGTSFAPPVAPYALTYVPINGAQNVAANTALSLTFSEPVALTGSGSITITNITDSTANVIVLPNAGVTISGGDTMPIAAGTANLVAGKNYAVLISADAIVDLNDSLAYAGINDVDTWAFDTDVYPPTVTSLKPLDEEMGVPPSRNLVMTFNEGVQKGTGNITVQASGDVRTIDVTTASVTVNGTVVTIDPGADLQSHQRYTVLIDSGAIRDLAGNVYGISDVNTWNFTSEGAVVALYEFTGSSYASSDTDIPTLASGISYGVGIAGAAISTGSQNGLSWGNPGSCVHVDSSDTPSLVSTVLEAVTGNQYLQFTITPVDGKMTLESLRFDYAAVAGISGGMTIDTIGAVRSSRDNYGANLLTWNANLWGGDYLGWAEKFITLDAAFFEALTEAVTFRIYLADNKNLNDRGHFLDNIRLSSVSVLPKGTLFLLR